MRGWGPADGNEKNCCALSTRPRNTPLTSVHPIAEATRRGAQYYFHTLRFPTRLRLPPFAFFHPTDGLNPAPLLRLPRIEATACAVRRAKLHDENCCSLFARSPPVGPRPDFGALTSLSRGGFGRRCLHSSRHRDNSIVRRRFVPLWHRHE